MYLLYVTKSEGVRSAIRLRRNSTKPDESAIPRRSISGLDLGAAWETKSSGFSQVLPSPLSPALFPARRNGALGSLSTQNTAAWELDLHVASRLQISHLYEVKQQAPGWLSALPLLPLIFFFSLWFLLFKMQASAPIS